MSITEKIQAKAKELLESGAVNYIIGWEKGAFWHQSTPVFVKKAAATDKLIWDEFCINSLSTYLIRLDDELKVGVFVKGCDSKGIVRLIQDKQLKREQVVLIGIPCNGMRTANGAVEKTDPANLPLEQKCTECVHPNPVIYDELIGEPVVVADKSDRFNDVLELEKLSPDEKYQYWATQFDKCIRCYACRNTCPACNCKECYVDQYRVGWQNKAVDLAENQMFHVTRAMHVAGRCVECGECQRQCPMGIPIMQMNRKLIKEINELFGEYAAGVDLEAKPPLGQFNTDDPEEFM
jgi:ferredoxin